MGTQFWWIFDAMVVIIAGYVIYSNAKRGLTKVVVLCSGYIVATILASVLAAIAAPGLYRSVARQSNINAIATVNRKVDFTKIFVDAIDAQDYGFTCNSADIERIITGEQRHEFDSVLFNYACRRNGSSVGDENAFKKTLRLAFVKTYGKEVGERLPEYVRMNFEEVALEDSEVMRTIITEVFDKKKSTLEAAEHIEDQFSSEATIEVLRIFIYLILFSIMMVFVALLSAALQNSIFINVRRSTDHLVGGLMGIFEACVMLVLLTIVVRLLLLLGGGDMLCFNEKTIANTEIFRYLYDNMRILL